ncbi:hypothetical protein Hdeb2414_s0018g00531291 [Helianthus debilis subsp. tardiflorus]
MLDSILQTKCMVLVFKVLQMVIGMRVLGMKEGDKGLVCILSETWRLNRVIGLMRFSLFQPLKIHRFLKASSFVSHVKVLEAVQI